MTTHKAAHVSVMVVLLAFTLPIRPSCQGLHAETLPQNPAASDTKRLPEPPAPTPVVAAAALSPEERGDLEFAHGRYAAAVATYRSIANPSAPVANKMGVAYNHLFALDEALKQYRLALQINPQYAEAYNNEGAVYQGKRNYSSAIKAYKHAVKLNDRLASAYYNLGETYITQGKYGKGSVALRKALQLDPNIFNPNRPGTINAFGTIQERIEIDLHLADIFATARQNTQALAELRQACTLGFSDRKRLLRDPDLRWLRDTPEFHLFLAEVHLNEAPVPSQSTP